MPVTGMLTFQLLPPAAAQVNCQHRIRLCGALGDSGSGVGWLDVKCREGLGALHAGPACTHIAWAFAGLARLPAIATRAMR